MERLKVLAKQSHEDIVAARQAVEERNLERKIRTNIRRRRKWLEDRDMAIQPTKSHKDGAQSKDSAYVDAVYNSHPLSENDKRIRQTQRKQVNREQSFHGRRWKSETEMIMRQQYD
uniref:Butyrophilin subfamily 2 member A2 n=1 Tax=Lygus hesperus TaxID=30085 RepID=A0A0A9ZAM4_LYGHE